MDDVERKEFDKWGERETYRQKDPEKYRQKNQQTTKERKNCMVLLAYPFMERKELMNQIHDKMMKFCTFRNDNFCCWERNVDECHS